MAVPLRSTIMLALSAALLFHLRNLTIFKSFTGVDFLGPSSEYFESSAFVPEVLMPIGGSLRASNDLTVTTLADAPDIVVPAGDDTLEAASASGKGTMTPLNQSDAVNGERMISAPADKRAAKPSSYDPDKALVVSSRDSSLSTLPLKNHRHNDPWASLVQQHDGYDRNYTAMFDRLYRKHKDVFKFGEAGREMMDTLLQIMAEKDETKSVTLLEIGVWLGQSTARWLQLAPSIRVIGVDPFSAPKHNHPKLEGMSPADRAEFGKPRFNKALAQYVIDQKTPRARNRTLLLQGFYPQAAEPILVDKLVDIDVFYIDGGKTNNADNHVKFINETIRGMLNAFPDAIVSGDDWTHVSYDHSARFQEMVKSLSRYYNRKLLVARERTWIMSSNLPAAVTRLGKQLVP